VLVTYGLLTLLWVFASDSFLSLEKYTALVTLWVITVILFSALWYLLQIKMQPKKHVYLWDSYKQTPDTLNAWDVLVMLILPSLIILVFNSVHSIV